MIQHRLTEAARHRLAEQLDRATREYAQAAERYRDDPSPENSRAMQETAAQLDLLMEAVQQAELAGRPVEVAGVLRGEVDY